MAYYTQADLDNFIKDLTGAIVEMDNKASQVSWRKKQYAIFKYDFSKEIYVQDSNGAYAIVNKKSAENLLTWLTSFKIGIE